MPNRTRTAYYLVLPVQTANGDSAPFDAILHMLTHQPAAESPPNP